MLDYQVSTQRNINGLKNGNLTNFTDSFPLTFWNLLCTTTFLVGDKKMQQSSAKGKLSCACSMNLDTFEF